MLERTTLAEEDDVKFHHDQNYLFRIICGCFAEEEGQEEEK